MKKWNKKTVEDLKTIPMQYFVEFYFTDYNFKIILGRKTYDDAIAIVEDLEKLVSKHNPKTTYINVYIDARSFREKGYQKTFLVYRMTKRFDDKGNITEHTVKAPMEEHYEK